MPPGRSARPSPTTCCAPPAPWPATGTPWPAGPPCAGRSSPCPPGWPDRNAAACCACPRTGPGPHHGLRSTTPCSPPGRHQPPPDPAHPPARARPETRMWIRLGRPAGQTCPHAQSRSTIRDRRSTPKCIHGSRLSIEAPF
jgi:hypothetical protein